MADELISNGADAHVPAIDDDQGQTPAGAEEAAVEQDAAAGEAEGEAGGDEGAAAEVAGGGVANDPYYKEFINRTGLDPNDPNQLKTLKTLVDQKKYIEQLKAQAASAPATEGLTPFEQELMARAKALADAQAQAQQQNGQRQPPPQSDQPGYQDIGSEWKSADDAYKAYSDAWAEAAERGDYRKVNQIDQAIFRRRMDSMLPLFQNLVQQYLGRFEQERLGEYLPAMQEGVRAQQLESAYSFAMKDLSKAKGYEDVTQLDAEDGGPPIVVDGEEYRPTAMNRILADNPWIMNIRVDHQDRDASDRLTYIARLRAVHKIFSSAKVNASKAEQLFDAGKTAATNQQKQKVRQSLNAGEGAKTALGQNGKGKSFVSELLAETDDGPKSFASL